MREIYCLGPDGEVRNASYPSRKLKMLSLARQKNLKMLTREMKSEKVEFFSKFIDDFLEFKNKNVGIGARKLEEEKPRPEDQEFEAMKKSLYLEILKPVQRRRRRPSSGDSDLMFEEVNWNKKHVDKGAVTRK